MKIVKLSISNYKGIENEQIIDFSNRDLIIFDGPNGFGKTTIFDAIELCLRGKICRIQNNCQVTNDTNDYKKPFFQNKSGKPVIIKCHVKNSNNNDLVIVKYVEGCGGSSSCRIKKNKVSDWDLLETYRIDTLNFELDFNKKLAKELKQTDINHFFFGDNLNFDLEKIYLLFNYVQQEENLFFLKQSEYSKKKELSFLFQTEKEEKCLEKIKSLIKICKGEIQYLEEKIDLNEKQINSVSKIKFNRLFERKDLQFDTENPFEKCSLDSIDTINSKFHQGLNDINDFISNFSVEEYKKYIKLNEIKKYYENDEFLKFYLLKNVLLNDGYSILNIRNTKIKKYNDFNKLSFDEKIINCNDLGLLGLEDLGKFDEKIAKRQSLISLMNENSKMLSSLKSLRDQFVSEFDSINDYEIEKKECPICGCDWKTIEELAKNILKRSEYFEKFNEGKIKDLEQCDLNIQKDFFDKIDRSIDSFLQDPLNKVDKEFLDELYKLENINFNIDEKDFIKLFEESEINHFILDISDWSQSSLMEKLSGLKKYILSSINNMIVDSSKLKNLHIFRDYFDNDEFILQEVTNEKIAESKMFIEYKYYEFKTSKVLEFRQKKSRLLDFVAQQKKIKDIYKTSIVGYKSEMIKKIKIPFFVYSGRILQNYQQGFGIFIDIKENSTGVRFLTDPSNNDHDAIHQLSSGQLSVISIAFLLSLNKVYGLSGKFLAIDDPVQSLDDINIHSFIELLRHEFFGYQILLSTHDESHSNYINYKFGKFGFNTECFNVKENFYKVYNIDKK